MNTARWEATRAAQVENREVVWSAGRVWTDAELYDDVRRLAAGLIDSGMRAGDRVAITLPNSYELLVAVSGAWFAGGAVVVLGNTFREDLSSITRHCEPSVVIGDLPEHPSVTPDLRRALGTGFVTIGREALRQLVDAHRPLRAPVPRSGADLAQLCYTSGVSGAPKAVEFSHAAVDALRAAFAERATHPTTLLLAVPPAAFGARLHCTHAVTRQKYVLLERFEPNRVLLEIERQKVEELPLVPTMAKQLVAHIPERRYDCSSLKAVHLSGSHASPELIRETAEFFSGLGCAGGIDVVVHYGTTEAGGGISSTQGRGNRLVGRPLPGVTVRIVREDSRDAECGVVGDIVVRTPYAGRGYWRDRVLSESVFRSGEVVTEDVGYIDADGQLFVLGRRTDTIIQGGMNIDPQEVVAAIERIDGVSECAVVGIENDLLGEQVVACIVSEPGCPLREDVVWRSCREQLDPRKLPALIFFFEDMPKTGSGKICTAELRKVACERIASMSVAHRFTSSRRQTRRTVSSIVSEALGFVVDDYDERSVESDATFGDLGLDSVAAVRFAHIVGSRLGLVVSPTAVYFKPVVSAFVEWLEERVASEHGVGVEA